MKGRTFGRMLCGVLVVFFGVSCSAAEDPAPTQDDEDAAWSRPRSDERSDERRRMVDEQIAARGLTNEKVLAAMRSVPRHWFVPKDLQRDAYRDRPLPIGHGQTISQPYIVALMTERLKVTSTDKVLEVGTGSGYQAAMLSELTPHVFTIEIIRELAEPAAKRLKDHGYAAVTTKTGDGYYGWEEHGPYDGIIVTAAAAHVPPPLVKQLKPGGRMVIPVGSPFRVQQLMLVEKDAKGKITSRVITPVRFVPLTGGPRK